MRSIVLVILVVVALASSGCVRPPYTQAPPVRFAPGAPAGMTFPALVQHATALGYVLDAVDPMRGMFAVHSRMLGRAPRRGRRAYGGPIRSNLFVVHVQEGEVRVTAIGRHVSEDGSMHPTLAQELEIFGESMRRAANAIAGALTAGGTMPAPPSAYGVQAAPAYGAPAQPPSAYGAPPGTPPPSYGAAPAEQPPSYATPVQPPSSYGAPPTAEPPPAYGAPASPEPPATYGGQPGTPPAAPSTPDEGPAPSPARRLGAP